jgi:hypothetical protein
MSESDIAIRAGAAVNGLAAPAGSVRSASDVVVAAPRMPTSATRLGSLLLWAVSFPAMLGTFLIARVFVEGRAFFVDPDLWWHIKSGETILATHRWPTTDPFSFTVAGQPWLSYEWLGDVFIATVARVGGLRGLDFLLIALGSAVIIALYALTSIRSGNSKAGLLASWLLFSLANASFSLRPQMLGYLFLILTLIALERFRQGKPRALWFLPALFLVWINTHGSWVIGLGVIAVYWLSGLMAFHLGGIEARRWTSAERLRIASVFLLCLVAIPITPYGTQLAAYPFQVASSVPVSVANILEWQPMPFNLWGGKLFLALLLAFFIFQIAFRFTWRLEELALFLGGTAMACLHLRFLLLFVPFFAPLFATIFARWLPPYDRAKEHYVLNGVLMAAAVAAMIWYFPSRIDIQRKVAERFPVDAVDYLRQHPVPGPMFNAYGFGGYLIWSRGPEHKVFVDGRTEIYELGGVFPDYMHIIRLQPGALSVLRAYGIQSCLLERDEPLATLLAALPDWQKLYSDNVSALFVRRRSAESSDALPLARPAPKEPR